MSATPNLRLPFLDANQNQKSVTHNAALRMLDALVNLRVASAALSAPPAAPDDGQCWIVAPGGTGAWLGRDLDVAAWQDGAWCFYAPNPGFVAYVDALGGALLWNGTAWGSPLGAVTSLALATLGVGTAADPANPLSACLNAALFSALPTGAAPAGTGDVRLKLSKQAAGNTASLLFQDAFSGRAEIGLAGSDDLHVRVSPDGTGFVDALVVSAAGGGVSFTATPSAPTAAAGDATAKLATTSFVAASFVTYAYAGATYATAASPTLTGTPTAPTAAPADNSARLATTAYADRASAQGNLTRTQVSDAAYAVRATDRVVAVTALTAARTLTLPAASAFPAGATLTVVDESGACSAGTAITVAAAGSDRVSGAASAVLPAAYGYLAMQSNTSNKWTVVGQSLVPNRRTFTDVAADYGSSGTPQAVGTSFTRVAMTAVNQDAGGNWDPNNDWYVCPRSGVYQITATVRVRDGTAAGSQYGVGVSTAEADGPWFLWHDVGPAPASRSTYPYARLSFQNAGDRLRLFSYSDASGGVAVMRAGLQICLVSDAA